MDMRIAFYLNNLDEEYQLTLYRAVSLRARELGMELFCVQQERFTTQQPALNSYPSHKFLNVDGAILLTSVLMDEKSNRQEEQLRTIFSGIPCISLSIQIDQIPSLVTRTQNSMQELMNHLIYEHNYKKFIFLGGPEEHQDNIVRESVFRQSIEMAHEHDKDIEATFLYGNFNEYIARNKLAQYIEQFPDDAADVIVCANDTMAMGTMRVLRALRNTKWASCAVTGFDDVPGAKLESPALTTIRQPTVQMGSLAVETIYKMIMHQKVEIVQTLESSLFIRNSCGCTKEWEDEETRDNRTFSLKDFVFQIQRDRIKTEQIQRHASSLSYSLSSVTNNYEIIDNLRGFLANINVPVFYLFIFPEVKEDIKDTAYLYYKKNEEKEEIYNPAKIISLKEFFSMEMFASRSKPANLALHYLSSGREQLGMIVYEAHDNVHTQMCSLSTLLGSTVNKLIFLQREKDRSRELEMEVAKRTREIVAANEKLAEENQRRIQVEAEVLKISEQERMRFSMDLHDDICQRLAGISMMCRGMSAIQPDLQELSTLIDETLHRTRQYAHDSFPMELESLGINEAIGNLCHTVQQQTENKTIVDYKWNAGNKLPLDRAQKINLFRIIQEALHNTIKHAKATKVVVSIDRNDDKITVIIKDNGHGNELLNKDPSMTEFITSSKGGSIKSVGIGLKSMYYRADQIGGKCSIKSTMGEGTSVTLIIPIEPENKLQS